MGNPPPGGPAAQRGIVKPAQPPTKVFVRVVFRSGEPVPDVTIFAENLRDSAEQRAATIKPQFLNGRYTHHLVWEIRADDFATGTEVTIRDKDGKDVRALKRTLDVKVRKDGFGPPPPPENPGSTKDHSTFAAAEARIVRDLIQGVDQTVELVLMDVRLGRMADPHDTPDWTNDLSLEVRARALFGDLSKAGAKPDFDPAFKRLAFLHKVGQITLAKEPQFNGADLVIPTSRSQRVTLKGPIAGVILINNWGSKATINVKRVPGQPPAYEFDKKFFLTPVVSNLDLRNAIGLYRLCARLRSRFGISELHHSGIGAGSGDPTNCHNIGTALDFSGVRMPARRVHPSLDEPFLIYVFEDWAQRSVPNQTAIDTAKAAGAATPASSGFGVDGRRDLASRPQQWVEAQRSTEYRLASLIIDPLPADSNPIQREDFDRRKAVLDVARSLFTFVFEFAIAEYSSKAGGSSCGSDCFAEGPVPLSPRMDTGDAIMHADYPKPDGKNANGSSQKNGREAHFTHMHFQIGPTSDPSGV